MRRLGQGLHSNLPSTPHSISLFILAKATQASPTPGRLIYPPPVPRGDEGKKFTMSRRFRYVIPAAPEGKKFIMLGGCAGCLLRLGWRDYPPVSTSSGAGFGGSARGSLLYWLVPRGWGGSGNGRGPWGVVGRVSGDSGTHQTGVYLS